MNRFPDVIFYNKRLWGSGTFYTKMIDTTRCKRVILLVNIRTLTTLTATLTPQIAQDYTQSLAEANWYDLTSDALDITTTGKHIIVIDKLASFIRFKEVIAGAGDNFTRDYIAIKEIE